MKFTSNSSYTTCHTPTNFRYFINPTNCSSTLSKRKSTQPTTPWMIGTRSASMSSQCDSATVCRTCTTTQPSNPTLASNSAKSYGSQSQYNGDSLKIQKYSIAP